MRTKFLIELLVLLSSAEHIDLLCLRLKEFTWSIALWKRLMRSQRSAATCTKNGFCKVPARCLGNINITSKATPG